MQKRRLISKALAALMVTTIVVIIVTLFTTTQLRAQVEGQEAPSSIHSEPVTEEGESITVVPDVGSPRPKTDFGPIDMSMFAGTSGASLAAHGQYVFVLHGNTLYQFAAEGLKLVNKVTLEEVQRLKKK